MQKIPTPSNARTILAPCKPSSEIPRRLSVPDVAQNLPCQQGDVVAHETHGAIGHADIHAAGGPAARGDDPHTTLTGQASASDARTARAVLTLPIGRSRRIEQRIAVT